MGWKGDRLAIRQLNLILFPPSIFSTYAKTNAKANYRSTRFVISGSKSLSSLFHNVVDYFGRYYIIKYLL